MKPQFLYLLHPIRPEMLTEGPTPQEQDTLQRHFGYLSQGAAAGHVLMFGRTQTTGPETLGLVIFQADDADAAFAFRDADPAVSDGVLEAHLYPYHVAGMGDPSLFDVYRPDANPEALPPEA